MVNSVNMLSNEETCSFFSWYEKKIIKMSDKNWNGVVVVFCLSASQTFGSCGYDSAVVGNYSHILKIWCWKKQQDEKAFRAPDSNE